MTLKFMDSFDHYTIPGDLPKKYHSVFQNVAPAFDAGGRTNGCISMNRVNSSIGRTIGQTTGYFIAGFGVYIVSGAAAGSICAVASKLYPNVGLFRNADATISAYRRTTPSNKTVLGTSVAAPFNPDTWHYIQLKVLQHPTDGIVIVKFNDSEILNLTGVRTMPTADDGPYTAFLLPTDCASNGYGGGAGTGTIKFDDLWICDDTGSDNNDFAGQCRVYVIYPNSDAGPNQWTPDSGTNHYDRVDEHDIDDDTTYLEVTGTTEAEVFGLEDSPVSVGSVAGVQLNSTVRKTTAGGANYKHQLRQAAVTAEGATLGFPSGTTYDMNCEQFDKDPTDNVDWSFAKVNSLNAGVKRNA